MARPEDGIAEVERNEERFPTPTTLPPPTTVPAPTVGGRDRADDGAGAATPAPRRSRRRSPRRHPRRRRRPPTPPPTPATSSPPRPSPRRPARDGAGCDDDLRAADDPDYVATLVPNLAGFTEHLSTPELVAAQIEELLAERRHDVAVPGPVASICAAIRMDRPLAVRGRWEHDGRRVASTDLERRDAPGFGECLTNDGDPLDDGSYQYIGADSNGNESAAGGIVVGAARLEQQLTQRRRRRHLRGAHRTQQQPLLRGLRLQRRADRPRRDVTLPGRRRRAGRRDGRLRRRRAGVVLFRPAAGTVQSLAP